MHTRPHRNVSASALGLVQDNAGVPLQACDWQQIARLGFSYAEVVEHFGEPPAGFRRMALGRSALASPRRPQDRSRRVAQTRRSAAVR